MVICTITNIMVYSSVLEVSFCDTDILFTNVKILYNVSLNLLYKKYKCIISRNLVNYILQEWL